MSVYTTQKPNCLDIPRLVIGAPQGRSGKTTATLGILRALTRKGYQVQPYKKGPDYIDPSWHSAAAGRIARNLDPFLMTKEEICRSIALHSAGSQFSIIEGAMGLYDGLDLEGSSSTAELAKTSSSPVLLVLDSTRITRTTAAIVMGCQHLDPEINITGVILNKVARSRHERIARESIEKYCHIPVVGAIPKDALITIPDRHLGLVTKSEMEETENFFEHLADIICENVDLSKIITLAQAAPSLNYVPKIEGVTSSGHNPLGKGSQSPRIGIIRDLAFSFYYPENLEALESKGADVVPFSALTTEHLPEELDALYIGGGFPEVFAKQLTENATLREEIRQAGENGLPIYAECGGLMYLGRSIIADGKKQEMVGLLPLDTQMTKKPQGHGYTIMKVMENNRWFTQERVRGHEFHNSHVINLDAAQVNFGFKVERGHGINEEYDGICYKNVLAAYNHIHAIGSPSWAEQMIKLACQYREQYREQCREKCKTVALI